MEQLIFGFQTLAKLKNNLSFKIIKELLNRLFQLIIHRIKDF